ncbi:hypothetical protein HGRIS_006812 [Hohenbuehelia grisea]|uniref:Uncharacterized protein n=1 Tax=Hohenbuehelia grisea TaxID=104357 RepID=A0ABR3JB94_9AGAR
MKLVMKRSILIEVYRSVHEVIEDNFFLTHRTIRHSHPKMTRTLQHLGAWIAKADNKPHVFTKGRMATYEVPDLVCNGLIALAESKDLSSMAAGDDNEGDAGALGVSGDDIGVE